MTLVEELREACETWIEDYELYGRAADHIEALDAARMQQAKETTLALMRVEELEAALREIVRAVEEEGQDQYDCAARAAFALRGVVK